MPNVILTPKLLTKMTLMNLGGYLNVCRNMSTEYSKEFGNKARKIGDTFDVRKPQRFTVSKQVKYDPQGLNDQKTTIKVDGFSQVAFECDAIGLTLDIEDVQNRYAKKAAIAIAHDINAQAAEYIAKRAHNAVGLPGTVPGTASTAVSDAVEVYLSAGDKLVAQGLPEGEELACIINRRMSSKFVVANKTLYNPTGDISRSFQSGDVKGDPLGYRWYKDQTIYTHTVGPLGGSPRVNADTPADCIAEGGNNGTMNLPTENWTADSASKLKAGDRFTIDGVYSVHPQTRKSTGYLQDFVVLADFSDTAGAGSVSIAPAITPTGQYQNVNAAPANHAAITVYGAANTVTPQGLLLHKDAFAFMSVPLENPPDGKGVISVAEETDPDTGLRLSYIQFFDGVNRVWGHRFDALYGFGDLYREMACAIYS